MIVFCDLVRATGAGSCGLFDTCLRYPMAGSVNLNLRA